MMNAIRMENTKFGARNKSGQFLSRVSIHSELCWPQGAHAHLRQVAKYSSQGVLGYSTVVTDPGRYSSRVSRGRQHETAVTMRYYKAHSLPRLYNAKLGPSTLQEQGGVLTGRKALVSGHAGSLGTFNKYFEQRLVRSSGNDGQVALGSVNVSRPKYRVLQTRARDIVITDEHVGREVEVYNGKRFIQVRITKGIIGCKLGEFSPTRRFPIRKISKRPRILEHKKGYTPKRKTHEYGKLDYSEFLWKRLEYSLDSELCTPDVLFPLAGVSRDDNRHGPRTIHSELCSTVVSDPARISCWVTNARPTGGESSPVDSAGLFLEKGKKLSSRALNSLGVEANQVVLFYELILFALGVELQMESSETKKQEEGGRKLKVENGRSKVADDELERPALCYNQDSEKELSKRWLTETGAKLYDYCLPARGPELTNRDFWELAERAFPGNNFEEFLSSRSDFGGEQS